MRTLAGLVGGAVVLFFLLVVGLLDWSQGPHPVTPAPERGRLR